MTTIPTIVCVGETRTNDDDCRVYRRTVEFRWSDETGPQELEATFVLTASVCPGVDEGTALVTAFYSIEKDGNPEPTFDLSETVCVTAEAAPKLLAMLPMDAEQFSVLERDYMHIRRITDDEGYGYAPGEQPF